MRFIENIHICWNVFNDQLSKRTLWSMLSKAVEISLVRGIVLLFFNCLRIRTTSYPHAEIDPKTSFIQVNFKLATTLSNSLAKNQNSDDGGLLLGFFLPSRHSWLLLLLEKCHFQKLLAIIFFLQLTLCLSRIIVHITSFWLITWYL